MNLSNLSWLTTTDKSTRQRPAPESPRWHLSEALLGRIWNSVLRAENTDNGELATALVFDVFREKQGLYMLLLMNQHFRFDKNHLVRVLQYDESGQCSFVAAFTKKDVIIFAQGNMKDRHEDYVIYRLQLDQNEWELTEPGTVRRYLKSPPSKKQRKAKSAAEIPKSEIICKTPRYSYSINRCMPVRIFGFPHTAKGRWEGASIVTSIDRSTFGLQMLSAPGLSGGAVVATEQGDVVGIMGGDHDAEENGKPKPFNAYAVHAHSFPKRPSSQPPSPES